jgi:YgiT-type zinc finger domain-containing protein
MPSKKRDCPVCGAHEAMVRETRDTPVTYKGHSRPHKTLTWWCTVCEDGIMEPALLAARERAFVALRAEVDSQPPCVRG